MREFFLIFKQAIVTKGKTKSFLITTAVLIASMFLLANISTIIGKVQDFTGTEEVTELHVIDESGQLFDPLVEQINNDEAEIELVLSEETEETLKAQVQEGEIDNALVLNFNKDAQIESTYYSMSSMEFLVPTILQDALQSIQTAIKANELSLAPEEVQSLLAPIEFEIASLSPSSKTEEELNEARGLVYALMFLIYFAVIFYSSTIASEVATEKSSRVMEILISSVSPTKHLFAKVFGIGVLGLMQMTVLGIAAYVALKTSGNEVAEGAMSYLGFSNLSTSTIIYAIVFFMLGYFLYATLAALLGSLVSRVEDVNQMIMPMTILIVIGFIIAASGLGNPELGYLKISSYIPFFSPFVMFLRVGMLDLPMWEPLLAISIMIGTILLLGWFAARVYKGGVLMYGPSRSLKDLKKAIQLGKE